ncbi:MAG TPA: tripartite tricarboxylate transporter substrate binding protein [Burkholderiales bacterium]|nr:tripartite tricarboxylate transporter substrate binding protein [Burkholderiales bacterium]
MINKLSTFRCSLFSIAACLAAGAPAVFAQKTDSGAGFPSRPIRVIVPFTPGGQPDIFSRMIGQYMAGSLGQQVVVDNRPGAGGMLGSRIVAEATPDGHTLLSISAAHSIGPSVRKLPYDTRRDFAGVSMAYNAAYLLVVPPTLGVKTTQDLIALAKSRPGQLNLASAGRGSGTHFAGEVFKHAAGIDVVHVPYKGIPEATNDIMSGRVQLFMAPLASSVPLIRDGRIRALGVTSPKRVDVLPDVPTIAEGGLKGFRWDSWGAIFAPAKTPRAVINKLNRAITEALRQPETEKRMRALGAEPAPSTPEQLDRFVIQDLAMVAKIAKVAGIKPE